MPIKVKLERQTVNQAEKADSSQIFVLNKSNPRGNVNFVVVDNAQQKISVQVPVTFVPVDLSVFSTKEDVLRNPNFRRLIARGFLHIISTESAEEFLKDERAAKEHNRIFDVLQEDVDLEFQAPVEDQINAAPPETKDAQVNQFVQNILLRAASENDDDLITELESKLDTLTLTDVNYLMDNTSSATLKAWCAEAVEAITE